LGQTPIRAIGGIGFGMKNPPKWRGGRWHYLVLLSGWMSSLAAPSPVAPLPSAATESTVECAFLRITPAPDLAALITTARTQIAHWRQDLKTPAKVESTRAAMANLAINLLLRSNRWEASGNELAAAGLRKYVKSALADVDWRLQAISAQGDVGALEARLAWLRSATTVDAAALCAVAEKGASLGGAEASYRRVFCISDAAQKLSAMRAAAALGHPAAMEAVGRLCLQGEHPEACAVRDLCRAAQSGRVAAASALGWRLTIPGTNGDLQAGRQWLQYAAENADVAAMNNLGELIERTQRDAADRQLASDWYRRAAVLGLPKAMVNRARLLAAGDAHDCAEAKRWLQQALASGLAPAQEDLSALACH
jgi:TPR repeat protein